MILVGVILVLLLVKEVSSKFILKMMNYLTFPIFHIRNFLITRKIYGKTKKEKLKLAITLEWSSKQSIETLDSAYHSQITDLLHMKFHLWITCLSLCQVAFQ
eukprot:NODE_23_length_42016_cov_0.755803.p36 type:complete len:102 gc:universal NODE_23_length_42016_cov_0.755803:11619-11314(-)